MANDPRTVNTDQTKFVNQGNATIWAERVEISRLGTVTDTEIISITPKRTIEKI